MKSLLLPVSLVLCGPSIAQITLENTAQAPLRTLLSLTAGPKLMEQFYGGGAGVVNIYDLDLSIYRTLTIPPPPSGVTWTMPNYITEALFDTDPATIEYMLSGTGPSLGGSVLRIYREDGTLLFNKAPGMALSGGGASDFDSWPAIFQTPDGAKLLVQAAFGSPTEVYSLPGDVPCISVCFPNAQQNFTVEVNELSGGGGGLSVQNPAIGTAAIKVELPLGARVGQLTIVDAAGRVVLTKQGISSGAFSLDTTTLASGTYLVHVHTPQGSIPAVHMTVIH